MILSTVAHIDRRAVVERHDVHLTGSDPLNPLTIGNGDFAVTVDATGLQTFLSMHDAASADHEERQVVPAGTLSTWGWHEMPNPEGYVLDDAMTEYSTARGHVRYPDRFDMRTMIGQPVAEEYRAGTWLHVNPQRIDLGRLGFVLRETDRRTRAIEPEEITDVNQVLRLWQGVIDTSFDLEGERVRVQTLVRPDSPTLSVRIRSALLDSGRLCLALKFGYADDTFSGTVNWNAANRHRSELRTHPGGFGVRRTLDATEYVVDVRTAADARPDPTSPHTVILNAQGLDALDVVARFSPEPVPDPIENHRANRLACVDHWERFWTCGAFVDFAGSTDPRAEELERRVVLSQYLTAVNCAGSMPPQETGLITNSWQGKSHLEMHWWHAAHFALWGRPQLLRRSMPWYRSILERARSTARSQHYAGARWPKQVGPDGRESPTDIGALLIWQQPHILYLLELLHRSGERGLVEDYIDLVDATATFMVDFVEQREDGVHLPAPVMPAQEVYDTRATEDPTFELAYWWWGLEVAQRWQVRAGRERRQDWQQVMDGLVRPTVIETGYAAVATPPYLRRSDHPSMLAAFGVIPPTPLIDAETMRTTLLDVVEHWDWDTAWGWDYPVMAMTATRLGEPELAVDLLLRDGKKNGFSAAGHNRQMGNFLPLYLPGNGGLLAAVSLMIAGSDSGVPRNGGFPEPGWQVRSEGFTRWP